MSRSGSIQRRRIFSWGRLIALTAIVIVGYSTIRYFTDKSHYKNGHQAYQQIDCAVAISHYDSILNGWRLIDINGYAVLAQQERKECRSFQEGAGKQQNENYSGALDTYLEFVGNYNNSALVDTTREKIVDLFENNNPSTLASLESCQQIDMLVEEGLIPRRDANLPLFYFGCGQVYEKDSNWARATSMYESFLAEYPDHSLAPDVEVALARSIVAQAKSVGADEIPPPTQSGSTSGGVTEVVIQNDSPERLRIVFGEPASRIETLSACSSCQTYSGIGPASCPERGPIGHYILKPGQYDVVVQSISDNGTTPWIGEWDLDRGDEYYSCFYIVTTSFGP